MMVCCYWSSKGTHCYTELSWVVVSNSWIEWQIPSAFASHFFFCPPPSSVPWRMFLECYARSHGQTKPVFTACCEKRVPCGLQVWQLHHTKSLVLCSACKIRSSLFRHLFSNVNILPSRQQHWSYEGLLQYLLFSELDGVAVPDPVRRGHCPCCCHDRYVNVSWSFHLWQGYLKLWVSLHSYRSLCTLRMDTIWCIPDMGAQVLCTIFKMSLHPNESPPNNASHLICLACNSLNMWIK